MLDTALLPPQALAGTRIGISVSASTDLGRLGLLEDHLKFALGELTRTVLVAGGGLLYGGRLSPRGYTGLVVTELQRYARRDRPLLLCLAWHEHRRVPLDELIRFRAELSLFGQLVCLDVNGAPVAADADRGDAPQPVHDLTLRRRALTGLRRYMCEQQQGRVFIGGQRYGFEGMVPGLIEEALLSLRAHQPIYLAGGFGGVTLDIVRALGIDQGDWLPPPRPALRRDPGFGKGIAMIRRLRTAAEFAGLRNGLDDDENRWLASSHRPSDIATLVGLGLGRLGQRATTDKPG